MKIYCKKKYSTRLEQQGANFQSEAKLSVVRDDIFHLCGTTSYVQCFTQQLQQKAVLYSLVRRKGAFQVKQERQNLSASLVQFRM